MTENPIKDAMGVIQKEVDQASKELITSQEQVKQIEVRIDQLTTALEALRKVLRPLSEPAVIKKAHTRGPVKTQARSAPAQPLALKPKDLRPALKRMLESNPSKWYRTSALREELLKLGYLVSDYPKFMVQMNPAHMKKLPWLRRHKTLRLVYYSLHPDAGGLAVSMPTVGEN